jgi:hypothetical protein
MEKLADTLSGEPLHIELNDSSPIHTAMGYPRPWVEALARELQRLCGPYQSDAPTTAEARAVPVEEELQDTPDHFVQREVLEQPASSPVLVARFSGGVLLHVPPFGLFRRGGGRFLFWFGYRGLKVQGAPVVELQVQPIAGGRFGILAGRDRSELDWLATILRRELHVPPDRLSTTE